MLELISWCHLIKKKGLINLIINKKKIANGKKNIIGKIYLKNVLIFLNTDLVS